MKSTTIRKFKWLKGKGYQCDKLLSVVSFTSTHIRNLVLTRLPVEICHWDLWYLFHRRIWCECLMRVSTIISARRWPSRYGAIVFWKYSLLMKIMLWYMIQWECNAVISFDKQYMVEEIVTGLKHAPIFLFLYSTYSGLHIGDLGFSCRGDIEDDYKYYGRRWKRKGFALAWHANFRV